LEARGIDVRHLAKQRGVRLARRTSSPPIVGIVIDMTKILVTGATGLFGSTLVPWLQSRGHSVLRHGHRTSADFRSDLRQYSVTAQMLDRAQPECIINLAALTDVDACERRPNDAYQLNTAAADHLCRWIRSANSTCHFVQISTDQVYDGIGPHSEKEVTICNTYAFSKRAAELAAQSVDGSVLRTNFVGRSRCATRRSFTDWLLQSLTQNAVFPVFEDILFSPLSLHTLSDMVETVVRGKPRGIFNVGAADGLSKADFAFAFAQSLDLRTTGMRRVRSDEAANLAAYRPKDMRMDSRLFESEMGVRLPTVAEEIQSLRADYHEFT
jgi:dTDP-4-dehydrorhamnose reductase